MDTILDNPETPSGKVYTDNKVFTATFLGGPLVAGYMIAENYKTFHEHTKARQTWIYAILATVAIFGALAFIPALEHLPSPVIPIAYSYAAMSFVKFAQGPQMERHRSWGGKTHPWWLAVLIGLLGLTLMLGLIFGAMYYFFESNGYPSVFSDSSGGVCFKKFLPRQAV